MGLWAIELERAPEEPPMLVIAAEDSEAAESIVESLRDSGDLPLKPYADGAISFTIRPASAAESEEWEQDVARAVEEGLLENSEQAYDEHYAVLFT